jgi:3-dehydro-L-gulonate 2-dehydrogenase
MKIPYREMQEVLANILLKAGFATDRAQLCATLFTDSSRDGVYTHGLNRFPRFMAMIQNGIIDIHARPELTSSVGALERWDGRRGPGNLNAHECMNRAMALARQFGMGCVALANTNHWMRGGSYGWQAAEANMIAMCWANTMPNMPPWGASEPRLGNNPLVIAVPRPDGHVVLDMAMSQFSYGALESYRLRSEQLPVAGGFDSDGRLSSDAGTIESSRRLLPIGFWKGSGLALMLDLLAAILSGGNGTHQITPDSLNETGLSQLFLAFDLSLIDQNRESARAVNEIIEFVHGAKPVGNEPVRYPGERTLEIRKRNLAEGIPVEPLIWQRILEMKKSEE